MTTHDENYVEVTVFEAVRELGGSVEGEDWAESFTKEELEQQDADLRSVVHAQQAAEVGV